MPGQISRSITSKHVYVELPTNTKVVIQFGQLMTQEMMNLELVSSCFMLGVFLN